MSQALEIAGHALGFAADAASRRALTPALRPLVTNSPIEAETTTWHCWESPTAHPLWHSGATGPLRTSEGGLVVIRPDPPAVEAYHPVSGLELWGAPGSLIAGDVRAHPASTALAAWLATRDVQVLHAGAVCFEGRAALVLGPSGAGKSTTTLACVLDGAHYLGDDLTAVTITPEPSAHCLYATAKLTPEADLQLRLEGWPTLGLTPKGKRVVAVPQWCPMPRAAPIAAMVFLTSPAEQMAPPRPMPARQVVRAIASTALTAGLGAGTLTQWLGTAAHLARTLPAWSITPSWDLPRLARDVRQAIERSDGRRHGMVI